jgi:lysozyme family protein
MDFDEAFTRLVDPQHEGGYVNNPKDPGGETKFGVSKRSYPHEDIANLTLERARALFKRDFWDAACCDAMPPDIRYELFDLAVNTSAPRNPKLAVQLLQRAAKMRPEEQDGIVGPITLMTVQSWQPLRLLRRLQGLRIRYYTGLRDDWWDEFGKGVMNRVASNMLMEG